MKLRKLRTALTVARTGTVATAARQLGLSQPAVTRALQSLEEEIGARPFHRGSRSLTCTDAGERLTAPPALRASSTASLRPVPRPASARAGLRRPAAGVGAGALQLPARIDHVAGA